MEIGGLRNYCETGARPAGHAPQVNFPDEPQDEECPAWGEFCPEANREISF